MRFFRRIAGILGFVKDEAHVANEEDDGSNNSNQQQSQQQREVKEERRRQQKGFVVKAHVAVDRGPVLTSSILGDGGVQGLRWYADSLKIDEDGDVASEFLEEVLPLVGSQPSFGSDAQTPLPKLQVNYNSQPAIVRKQMVAVDGRIHHRIEHQGRLQWV